MSDRIDLAALRHDAQLGVGGRSLGYRLTDREYDEAVLALIDAVEAAQAHVIARRDRLPSEWPRLLDALAHFDFGEA